LDEKETMMDVLVDVDFHLMGALVNRG